MTDRTLLNTEDRFDAGMMGLDGPVDFNMPDGLKITQADDGWLTLNGPDGEINIPPGALAMVKWAICTAKTINEQRGR